MGGQRASMHPLGTQSPFMSSPRGCGNRAVAAAARNVKKEASDLKAQLACLRAEALAVASRNTQWVERMGLKWGLLVGGTAARQTSSPRSSSRRNQSPRELKRIDYTPLSKLVKYHLPPPTPAARIRCAPSDPQSARLPERLLDIDRLIALRSKEKDASSLSSPDVVASPTSAVAEAPPVKLVSPPPQVHLAVADAQAVRWREGKDADMIVATTSGSFLEPVKPSIHTVRLERAFEEGRTPPTPPTLPVPEHSHTWSLRTRQPRATEGQRTLPSPPSAVPPPLHQSPRQAGGVSTQFLKDPLSGSAVPIRTPRTPHGKCRSLSQRGKADRQRVAAPHVIL
jgi:hypothetical protein